MQRRVSTSETFQPHTHTLAILGRVGLGVYDGSEASVREARRASRGELKTAQGTMQRQVPPVLGYPPIECKAVVAYPVVGS